MKVCLAGTYPAGTMEQFKAALPETEFDIFEASTQEEFDTVTDADAVVLRVLKMPAPTIERFSNLRMIMRWGVGFDSVDIQKAGEKGIPVCNTPGANAYAVAELAVALMINTGRHLFGYFENIKKNMWDREFFKKNLTLNMKTVGIIGGGNIGRQVAKRVQAFGAKTVYYDAFRLSEEMEKAFEMQYMELDELLSSSDIVTLHVPLTDETRHLINADRLSMMKKDAIVINTARGGLVNDASLLEALKADRIFGAGLDCLEQEKSEVSSELMTLKNVVITPHIGGTSSDLGTSIIPMIIDNLKLLASDNEIKFVVNKEYLK